MKLTDEQERKFGKAIMDSARCMGVYTPSEYAAMGRKAEELTREMHYREALAEPSQSEVERFLTQLRICGEPTEMRVSFALRRFLERRFANLSRRPQSLQDKVIAFLAERGCTFTAEGAQEVGDGLLALLEGK